MTDSDHFLHYLEFLNPSLPEQKIADPLEFFDPEKAESRMREQYSLLVRQSSEALKVRQQLEEERERVRVASSAAGPATVERATTAKSTEAKW